MPRGRGGARQGTPGKGYSNRTDLTSQYNQQQNTAASGGMQAPPMPPVTTGPLPDEIPSLSTPPINADAPITSGLNVGPGPGPSRDKRASETQELKRFLPLLELYLDQPETPDSVRMLFRYIRSS